MIKCDLFFGSKFRPSHMVQENPAGSSQGNEIEKVLEMGQTTNRKTTTRI